MKVNYKLLKQIMIGQMKGDSFNAELASVLNISYPAASLKMRGKTNFTTEQMNKIKEHYNLSNDLFMRVFLGG